MADLPNQHPDPEKGLELEPSTQTSAASTIRCKNDDDDIPDGLPADQISISRTRTAASVAPEGLVAKTLSLVRTRDFEHPGPPPDGGFEAWLQASLAHVVVFNSWGYISSFGVFQTYYADMLHRPPSDISWIGGIQIFLLFFIGTFSGRATDAGYFKAVWSVGAVIVMISIFMSSLCTTYWQLLLAQGVCFGTGCGLMFCPTVALLPTYFSSKVAFALAIGACGTATGGMVFAAAVQRLLPAIGFAWTMRALGLITVVTLIPGFIFLRQRLPPRKSGPFFELAAFREPQYTLYAIGMYLSFWGLWVAYYYVGSFGRDVIGLDLTERINMLIIMNSAGIPGRLVPSSISDRLSGPFNAMLPCTLSCAALLFGWIGISDRPSLYVFSVLYGFVSAGVQGLFPAAASSLTTDLKKTGIRFGMLLSIVSFASLTGSPIAGALIQAGGGDYLYAQIFSALCLTVGAVVLVAARYKIVGFDLVRV